jgi:hypothetical protein
VKISQERRYIQSPKRYQVRLLDKSQTNFNKEIDKRGPLRLVDCSAKSYAFAFTARKMSLELRMKHCEWRNLIFDMIHGSIALVAEAGRCTMFFCHCTLVELEYNIHLPPIRLKGGIEPNTFSSG